MTVAHDIYAETNPAFCTYALVNFTQSYLSVNANGPEMPTAYLVLPLALSGDLAGAFGGTNKNTGLLEWLERNPQVQVGLAERVNASMEIVSNAISFGCFAGVLSLANGARLQVGEKKLNMSALKSLGADTIQAVKHAERLGYWFATAGSTRTVFDILGLMV